jgi:predicted phage terminase large subunit-like protein
LPDGIDPSSGRVFIPANLYDNPFLKQDEYAEGLDQLGDVTKAQLLSGDWTATSTGGYFQAEEFQHVGWGEVPDAKEFVAIIRYWDFAATQPSELNPDPDYTVGLKLGMTTTGSLDPTLPDFYVLDVERFRLGPGGVEDRIRAVALKDGPRVVQWLEQERGAAGKLNFNNYALNVLTNSTARPLYALGTKESKAAVAAARVKEGRVFVVDGEWNADFIAECAVFPLGSHDDQVDCISNGIVAIHKERAFVSQGTVQRIGQFMKPVRRGKRREPAKHYGY